jgi:hypothetical protein
MNKHLASHIAYCLLLPLLPVVFETISTSPGGAWAPSAATLCITAAIYAPTVAISIRSERVFPFSMLVAMVFSFMYSTSQPGASTDGLMYGSATAILASMLTGLVGGYVLFQIENKDFWP